MDMILNRCPFCGGEDVTLIPMYEEGDQLREVGGKIQCNECLATFTHPEATSREDLIECWNKREIDEMNCENCCDGVQTEKAKLCQKSYLAGTEHPKEWVPIKTREMTEEEKREWGYEYSYTFDGRLPDEGEEVLVTTAFGVDKDVFFDGSFEQYPDPYEVSAWMPLPKPYKEKTQCNQ